MIADNISIPFGKISIRDEYSIVQCRNKIRVLSMDLGFSAIEATRIATAASEICWVQLQNEKRSTVDVYLDSVDNRPGLLVVFREVATQFNTNTLEFLFDQLKVVPINQLKQDIRAFKFLSNPSFNPSSEFIKSSKDKIAQLSKEELMEELKEAIDEADKAKTVIEESYSLLADKNRQIRDSINFASMIQNALLPEKSDLENFCADSFVIWEPKDIVGGDIFFIEKLRNENELILFVIDCTGHGVPGALVTAIVKAVELQALAEVLASKGDVSPAQVLRYFNTNLKYILKQEDKTSKSNAGFDGGVLYINKAQKIVKFAGAETPLFYIQDNKMNMIKGDRQSIGYKKSDTFYQFKDHTIEIDRETCFYIVTDGFLDQNGGEKGYPYGKKQFQKLLLDNHNLDFAEQKKIYLDTIHQYRGTEDTTDDMTFVGLKVN